MNKVKFSELEITKEIKRAVADIGFEETTAIQALAIPAMLAGRDVIGQAQTGTGKTAAFGIPAVEKVDMTSRKLQVLVLCPTRELAIQACDEIRKFAKYRHGIKTVPIFGGQPIERQIRALKGGAQIIIGTPGRVMDHMRRHTLRLDDMKIVVLDEADEMLSMGFREDIETILKDAPEERQTVLFSATMPKEVLAITKMYQKNAEIVKVQHQQLTAPDITQYYYEVPEARKSELLANLIDTYDPKLSLVFCNTKKRVDDVVAKMQAMGYQAQGLHGDMKQVQRTKVMDSYRKGKFDILVATDVAARGIDVDDVEAVFNYDIPQDEEYYVHRIGRTGRAGRAGRAFSFVAGRRQIMNLKEIQRYANTKIIQQSTPTRTEMSEKKVTLLLEDIKGIVASGGLEKYENYIDRLIAEECTSIEAAAALMKMMLEKEPPKEENEGPVRLFINTGRTDKLTIRDLTDIVARAAKCERRQVENIVIHDNYSFADVPREKVAMAMDNLKNQTFKGRKMKSEIAKDRE